MGRTHVCGTWQQRSWLARGLTSPLLIGLLSLSWVTLTPVDCSGNPRGPAVTQSGWETGGAVMLWMLPLALATLLAATRRVGLLRAATVLLGALLWGVLGGAVIFAAWNEALAAGSPPRAQLLAGLATAFLSPLLLVLALDLLRQPWVWRRPWLAPGWIERSRLIGGWVAAAAAVPGLALMRWNETPDGWTLLASICAVIGLLAIDTWLSHDACNPRELRRLFGYRTTLFAGTCLALTLLLVESQLRRIDNRHAAYVGALLYLSTWTLLGLVDMVAATRETSSG